MSQHLVEYGQIENERLALIEDFTDHLEHVIDALVDARVQLSLRQLPPPRLPPPAPRLIVPQQPPRLRDVEFRTRPLPPPLPTKAATVIPAHVQIKRLPPGPSPRGEKRNGPSMDCRCPGCPMKSRGPRYEYFCGDHYRALNADDRRKYAEMWRTARAARAWA